MTRVSRIVIPSGVDHATLTFARREVHLTNLRKPFRPEHGIAKGALLQYCSDVAPVLLPHIRDRAMVMKRAPTSRPAWIRTCPIQHTRGATIDFPVVAVEHQSRVDRSQPVVRQVR